MATPNVGITREELEAATKEPGGMVRLFERQRAEAAKAGVNLTDRSLPSTYETKNGRIQVKPKSFMEKYGWLLAAAPMGVGAAMAFAPAMFGAGAAGGGSAAAGGGSAAASAMPASVAGIPGGATSLGLPVVGAGTSSTAGAGSMGFLDTLKGVGKKFLGNMGDRALDTISRGTGNASQAMASNRGTMAELMMDQNSLLERELLAREQEKRDARRSAYRDMMTGNLAMNFKPAQRPGFVSAPSYTQGSSLEQIMAGRQLADQGSSRMAQPDLANPGGMPAYRNLATDPEFLKNMKPGAMERIFGYTSALSPFLGAFRNNEEDSNPGGVLDFANQGKSR